MSAVNLSKNVLNNSSTDELFKNLPQIPSPRNVFNYYRDVIAKFDAHGDPFLGVVYKDNQHWAHGISLVIFARLNKVRIFKGSSYSINPDLRAFNWDSDLMFKKTKDGDFLFNLSILTSHWIKSIFGIQSVEDKYTLRFEFDSPVNSTDNSLKAIPDSLNFFDIEITNSDGTQRSCPNKNSASTDKFYELRLVPRANLFLHAYALSNTRVEIVGDTITINNWFSSTNNWFSSILNWYHNYYEDLKDTPGNKNVFMELFDSLESALEKADGESKAFISSIVSALAMVLVVVLFSEGILLGSVIASAVTMAGGGKYAQKAIKDSLKEITKHLVKSNIKTKNDAQSKTLNQFRNDFFATLGALYSDAKKLNALLIADLKKRNSVPNVLHEIMGSGVPLNELIQNPEDNSELLLEVTKSICRIVMQVYSKNPVTINYGGILNDEFKYFDLPTPYTEKNEIEEFFKNAINFPNYAAAETAGDANNFRGFYLESTSFDINLVYVKPTDPDLQSNPIDYAQYKSTKGYLATFKIWYMGLYPHIVDEQLLIKHIFKQFPHLNKTEFFTDWDLTEDIH